MFGQRVALGAIFALMLCPFGRHNPLLPFVVLGAVATLWLLRRAA